MAVAAQSIISRNLWSVLDFCVPLCSKQGLHSTASSSWSVIRHQLISRSNLVVTSAGNLQQSSSFASKANPRMTFSADSRFSKQPIVFINATYNNTLLTLTDYKGNTLAWTSADTKAKAQTFSFDIAKGTEGYKNSRRGSSVAAQEASLSLAKKATDFGIKEVRIKLKGIGNGRQASVKGLTASGLKITSITDITPIPHNGCRPKKARRI